MKEDCSGILLLVSPTPTFLPVSASLGQGEEFWLKLSCLLWLAPCFTYLPLYFGGKKTVSGQVGKEASLLLVFAVGWVSNWSASAIAEGLLFGWGRNVTVWSAFSCCIVAQKCQPRLPSSVACRDVKHPAALWFLQPWDPTLVHCPLATFRSFPLVVSCAVFMVYICV